MTKQEIFERVQDHLLTQKAPALDKNWDSRYRIRKGSKILKDSIGCLIPKKEYKKDFEALPVDRLPIFEVIKPEDANKKTSVTFMRDLQRIHDDYAPQQWKYQLVQFKKKYGLK